MNSLKACQCMNPDCSYHNPYNNTICDRCGSRLLLKGRYRALRQIGSGGFARTFEATDEDQLASPCVIKQFCPHSQNGKAYEQSLKLFEQEAKILKILQKNSKIPSFIDFFEQEGRLYIVQEFIEGLDLFKEVAQNGVFNEQKVRQVLLELLPVLQFIHDSQVIHRDIKPSNIIRQPNGSLVLIDFGSSQKLQPNSTEKLNPIIGTPGYASLEQIQGRACSASDIYSLGVTCMRLLSGSFPSKNNGDPLFDWQQKQWNWRTPGITVSSSFGRILDGMLQWDVRSRFACATEVLQALKEEDKGKYLLRRAERPSSSATFNLHPKDGLLQRLSTSEGREEIKVSRSSKTNASYSKLTELLIAQNYESADRETWNLMLHIAKREKEGCLNLNGIEQFPIQDLLKLDRLWQTYSNGNFGFSIQKQIYQNLGGSREFDYEIWKTFGELVGWYERGHWLNYRDLNFSHSAPVGHLPVCFVDVLNRAGIARDVCGWWRLGFVALIHRLDECQATLEQSQEEIAVSSYQTLLFLNPEGSSI
ncbi:protein kinase [Candidatus Gracilibacteria bacterium]|nr:protein kinase [Candidatus Gracilibacteria bacterium]